ncbi:hypothetical protein ACOMHN_017635 [Nucella lapillus]
MADRAARVGNRPNVCPYQDMDLVVVRQPCVQAFTRLVKVWKPHCGYTRNWCVGYERRTHYYTTFRNQYRQQEVTKYKCCNGWSQQSDQGCTYRMCKDAMCYNGGQCSGGYYPSCSCPVGFQGPQCQHDHRWLPISSLTFCYKTKDAVGVGHRGRKTRSDKEILKMGLCFGFRTQTASSL